MSTLAVAAEMDPRGYRRAFRERGDNSDADPWRVTPPQKVTGSSSRKRPASKPLYWAEKIASFDGFVMVTPEHNHSTSGVLKNDTSR
jgi:NADPH-dependent FMN reductase